MIKVKHNLILFFSFAFLLFSCAQKDSDIQKNINEKFSSSPTLSGASATVDKGVATLTGTLADEAARSEAENKANEVKGVKSVVNNTIVQTPEPAMAPAVSDSGLERGVMDATKDYPGVKATVDNGQITLTGSMNRADLPKLMQALNSLNPGKINNELNLK